MWPSRCPASLIAIALKRRPGMHPLTVSSYTENAPDASPTNSARSGGTLTTAACLLLTSPRLRNRTRTAATAGSSSPAISVERRVGLRMSDASMKPEGLADPVQYPAPLRGARLSKYTHGPSAQAIPTTSTGPIPGCRETPRTSGSPHGSMKSSHRLTSRVGGPPISEAHTGDAPTASRHKPADVRIVHLVSAIDFPQPILSNQINRHGRAGAIGCINLDRGRVPANPDGALRQAVRCPTNRIRVQGSLNRGPTCG